MSNQLQNKLFYYEVQPPEGVWETIAASLDDENFSPEFARKLNNYEASPSPDIWKNINTQLNDPIPEKGKLVPFHVRFGKPLRYSGTVALFIFLAVLTSLLISKKTESELPGDRAGTSAVTKESLKTPPATENILTEQANKDKNANRSVTRASIAKSKETGVPSPSFTENILPRQVLREDAPAPSISSDKYMIYSDRDGNVIRLPKKIFSVFACPVNDLVCRQHLQQLREKFAASAMTADFNGLLQILKSLQENQ